MRVAIGLGCDRDTAVQTLARAVDAALASCGLSRQHVAAAASIDKKADEQAILALAAAERWPLSFYPAEALARVDVPNPSATVLKHVGTPSVSEAAALLAAGAEMSALLVEKFKYLGEDGRNATVSIARLPEPNA